jgi:hypothetical protein
MDVTGLTASLQHDASQVMGRKTWESLPAKVAPLPGRLNVVLSRVLSAAAASKENAPASHENAVVSPSALPPSVLVQPSLRDALQLLSTAEHAADIDTVYVIGGAQVPQSPPNLHDTNPLHPPAFFLLQPPALAALVSLPTSTHGTLPRALSGRSVGRWRLQAFRVGNQQHRLGVVRTAASSMYMGGHV